MVHQATKNGSVRQRAKKSPARRELRRERGCVRVKTSTSEDHLGAELQRSGVKGAGDLTDVRTADGAVDASAVHISTKLRVIPDVIGFESELGVKPFGKGNVLKQRHVPVVTSRTA